MDRNRKKKKRKARDWILCKCRVLYPVVPQVDATLQEEQTGEGAGGRREAGVFAAHPAEKVQKIIIKN